MCAFLGEANMHEQLFGHLLAVGRLTLLPPNHACLYIYIPYAVSERRLRPSYSCCDP